MNGVQQFYSGTSGLVVPFPRSVYPAEHSGKSRLEFYATLFNSVEVNSTFYKTPQQKTVAKWDALVPADFRFTFKIPKLVSHARQLDFPETDIRAFLALLDGFQHRGVLLLQLPPGLQAVAIRQLERLLQIIGKENTDWPVAVEFRHVSWYDAAGVRSLLEKHEAAAVVHDLPSVASPLLQWDHPFCYYRFHGPEAGYRGSYENATLTTYAKRISADLQQGKTVYAYFNNTMGAAFANLQQLNRLVAS